MWKPVKSFGKTFKPVNPVKGRRAALVVCLFVALVIALGAYFSLTRSPKVQAASLSATSGIVSKVGTNPNITDSAASSSVAPASSNANVSGTSVPNAPSCTPDTSYTLPSTIQPTQPGLSQVIDTPSTYTVYGNTTNQIVDQMNDCTPVHTAGVDAGPGNYAASTAEAIDWDMTYEDNNGVCSVSSVSVTLHINQVFPSWQPSAGSPANLSSQWQAYITKLHAYENGHVQLDEQDAQAIDNDLNNLPATSCDTINQVATSKAQADMAYYNQANANYDTNNQFGLQEDVVL